MVLSNIFRATTPRRGARPSISRSASKSSVKKVNNDSTKSNIKVVVRCRPPNERELGGNFHDIIKIIDDQMLIFDPKVDEDQFYYHGVRQTTRDVTKRLNKNINFMFDKVFGFEATNNNIYEQSINEVLDSIMNGYNCSVFAYGATGAGKTFTMLGSKNSPGISYLTMEGLFNRMKQYNNRTFKLVITYVEVYNENVQDLLSPTGQLHLREDRGNVVLTGVSVHSITSANELITMLEKGNLNRTQHPTDANSQSSRSHAVFQIHIHMTNNTTGVIQKMKLSMIDLAGSERASATSGLGMRFKEGSNINKSLLALANCINSLADGHNHIPYRDSKLTRLLKDSLGGNCRTVMIANISPSSLSFEDTYNTLKYATRAKNIQTNTSSNIVHQKKDLVYYVERVKALELENENLRKKINQSAPNSSRMLNPLKIDFDFPQESAASNIIKQQFADLLRMQNDMLQVQGSKKLLEYSCKLKQDKLNIARKILKIIPEVESDNLKLVERYDNDISAFETKISSLISVHNDHLKNLRDSISKYKSDNLRISIHDEIMKVNMNAVILQCEHLHKLLCLHNQERSLFCTLFEKLITYPYLKRHLLLTSEMRIDMESIVSEFQKMSLDNLANKDLVQWTSLVVDKVPPSLNDESGIEIQSNYTRIIKELCEANNKLLDQKSLYERNSSYLEQSKTNTEKRLLNSEKTFLIPEKPVQQKHAQINNWNSQKQLNVLNDATSKSMLVKSQVTLFKSPKGEPIKNRKENKENILNKKVNKTVKSFGTMGTTPRFPQSSNSGIKSKITSTIQKVTKK